MMSTSELSKTSRARPPRLRKDKKGYYIILKGKRINVKTNLSKKKLKSVIKRKMKKRRKQQNKQKVEINKLVPDLTAINTITGHGFNKDPNPKQLSDAEKEKLKQQDDLNKAMILSYNRLIAPASLALPPAQPALPPPALPPAPPVLQLDYVPQDDAVVGEDLDVEVPIRQIKLKKQSPGKSSSSSASSMRNIIGLLSRQLDGQLLKRIYEFHSGRKLVFGGKPKYEDDGIKIPNSKKEVVKWLVYDHQLFPPNNLEATLRQYSTDELNNILRQYIKDNIPNPPEDQAPPKDQAPPVLPSDSQPQELPVQPKIIRTADPDRVSKDNKAKINLSQALEQAQADSDLLLTTPSTKSAPAPRPFPKTVLRPSLDLSPSEEQDEERDEEEDSDQDEPIIKKKLEKYNKKQLQAFVTRYSEVVGKPHSRASKAEWLEYAYSAIIQFKLKDRDFDRLILEGIEETSEEEPAPPVRDLNKELLQFTIQREKDDDRLKLLAEREKVSALGKALQAKRAQDAGVIAQQALQASAIPDDDPSKPRAVLLVDAQREALAEEVQKKRKLIAELRAQVQQKLKALPGEASDDEIYEQDPEIQQLSDRIQALESELAPSALPQQTGQGKNSDGGLWNDEIEQIMKPYLKHGFVGVYSIDEMDQIPKQKEMSFVLNTEPSTKRNGHWVGVHASADKDMSVEYYDPFAEEPPKAFLKGIKKIADRISPDIYLKLKINRIKSQDDRSDSCGWLACQFLVNRMKGKPWKECSGYSDVRKSEKSVKMMKKKYKEFGYI
jgi:predicted  nucleic acid-binding Zn-ribbon protein